MSGLGLVTALAPLLPVQGVRLGIAQAGIKKPDKDDICLLLLDEGCSIGAVFTQNRFCAAPVILAKARIGSHVRDGAQAAPLRALIINTGNANAGTGACGMEDARAVCLALADLLNVPQTSILPFSTGVIMEPLPVEKILQALPKALANADAAQWQRACEAILTTDTRPKAVSQVVECMGQALTITGMAKGAGMIHPNMATMLGFMATNARLTPAAAQALATHLAHGSFNCITVDGDTSTNDSFVVIATNKAQHPIIEDIHAQNVRAWLQAMEAVAVTLAQAIVRDGEGATKFIDIQVEQGASEEECRKVARAIAHSPLVKTAFFASDPNLGRILAAIGYAGIADLDISTLSLFLGDVWVAQKGARHPDYREEDGKRVMRQPEITVRVLLGRGQARAQVWTCDLSAEYVRINADYRS